MSSDRSFTIKHRWCLAVHALSVILYIICPIINEASAIVINHLNHKHHSRIKRFALEGHRWPGKDLTYKISTYPTKFKSQKDKVDRVFKVAFDTWSKVSVLNFEAKSTGNVDISIEFVRNHHNHCTKGPLTATNKLLAHAFFPELNNIKNRPIHFNDYIDWSLDVSRNNDNRSLLATALHEIGHSLGLAHSKVKQAKMFSVELGRQDLHRDDIIGIQVLYGGEISLKQFYSIRNRWFLDENLDLYDKTASSLGECAKYALRTGYNLTIYNRSTKKCSLKKDYNYTDRNSYQPSGLSVTVHNGPNGYENDNTNFLATVEDWIAIGDCDLITKVTLRDDEDDRYICKKFEQNDCCTILFRLVEARTQESIS